MSRQSIKNTAAFKRLKKLHDQPGQPDLLWYHQVGEQVATLHPSESREYGESRIEAIANALGEKASYGDKLWKARNFFEKYTDDEVRYLNEPDPDSGYVLTWSHMIYLLSLDDPDRLAFEEDCLNAEWSTRQLKRAIDDYRPPKGRGGRRFQKPGDVESALRQLIDESRQWHRRFRLVWFHHQDPAISLDVKRNQRMRELASDAVEMLENLQADLESSLPRLKALATKKPVRQRKK